MQPYYSQHGIQFYAGHVLDVWPALAAQGVRVQTVVTSPPYFGLREYDTPVQQWPACDYAPMSGIPPIRIEAQACSLGQEVTPEAFIGHLVLVFRAVRQVLRPDGVMFVNVGDTYCTRSVQRHDGMRTVVKNLAGAADLPPWRAYAAEGRARYSSTLKASGLKDKDLMLIPARVALALQADGWYLRNECIWAKTATMPESVQDRFTRAHEQIFVFSQRPRYFMDMDAIREPATWQRENNPDWQVQRAETNAKKGMGNRNAKSGGFTQWQPEQGRNPRDVWTLGPDPTGLEHYAAFPREIPRRAILAGTSARGCCSACGTAWTRVVERERIPVRPNFDGTRGKLPKGSYQGVDRAGNISTETVGWQPGCRCTRAGGDWLPDDGDCIQTPTGDRTAPDPSLRTGRAGYNRPRGPQEGTRPITRYEQRRYAAQLRNSPHRDAMAAEAGSAFDHYLRTDRAGARPVPDALLTVWMERGWLERVTLPDYEPLDPVPCLVADPFLGSGTSAEVAYTLGRGFVGGDLNAEYLALAQDRLLAAIERRGAAVPTEAVRRPLQLGLALDVA